MAYKRLFIWVEGPNDELFFTRIIKPILQQHYDLVEIRTYSGETKQYINNYIKSINAMQGDYIFITDINAAFCITAKKQTLLKIYKLLEETKIIVVIKEIESWYLAGINNIALTEMGISTLKNTNNLTKETFQQLIPKRFDSRIDFMTELLKSFSLDVAKQKNKSLKYFTEKYRL